MPREKSALIPIPIFDCLLEFVVTGNGLQARNTPIRRALYGAYDDDFTGLLSYHRDNFLLILDKRGLKVDVLAHEVFHTTHRIMERCSHLINSSCHEPHAYLMGYITKEIYKNLRKWKIKLK